MTPAFLALLLALPGAQPTPSASPSPASTPPAADSCASGAHTNILSALNRPTIGFSPCAVKPRESLLELGYQTQTGTGGTEIAFPQGFLRFGTAPNVELDVIGPAYLSLRGPGPAQQGFADSGAGAKIELHHSTLTALGMDLLYTLPTGANAFSAGSSTETVNLDYSGPIGGIVTFGATLGASSTAALSRSGASSRFLAALPSAVLVAQFDARAQLYAEAFAQSRTRPDGGALMGLDGGVQYLVAPQIEVDAEAGRTITDVARAHYYGIGFGVRL